MPPFVEIDGAVYMIVDWEPDMPERERYELRRLSPAETERYRRLKGESEIESWANMRGAD